MVLEQIYPVKWISKKPYYSILLGIAYSVLGIFSAMLLFPDDPGLIAIAFTSLLILPSLNKLLIIEENEEARDSTFNLIHLFKEHKNITKIYLYLFLGILLTFSFFSIVLPNMATSRIFADQIQIVGEVGRAASPSTFNIVFTHNFKILIICLVASFIYGAGAILILTWNASVWGVIFGLIAKNAAIIGNRNPFVYFFITLIAVLPHLFAEAVAYFLVALSGGVVSTATLREKIFSKRFTQIITDALVIFFIAVVMLLIAAYIEAYVTHNVINFLGL